MTVYEIHQMLFRNTWMCNEFNGIIRFEPTIDGRDFDIVKIVVDLEIERIPFENINIAMTNEDIEAPDNKRVKYIGYLNYYIYAWSDNKIQVHLPGINECVLSKIDR